MGLFNFGSASAKIKDAREAYLGVIFAAMACDGQIEQEEVNSLMQILSNKKTFARMDIRSSLKTIQTLFGEKGSIGLVKDGVEFLNADQRLTVFATAADFLLADGLVKTAEENFLMELKSVFEISDEVAKNLVEALVIKNREL
jgi:uncharacterized tellurite resistance protein B-like protein